MKPKVVLVSACLVGLRTRYDGTDALCEAALKSLEGSVMVPVCPEQLGGMNTPRPACEISGGDGHAVLSGSARVVDLNGTDMTEGFIRGAEETLKAAHLAGAQAAYLKENSPSCGVTMIKKGSRTESGYGVTAALLEKNSIKVTGF